MAVRRPRPLVAAVVAAVAVLAACDPGAGGSDSTVVTEPTEPTEPPTTDGTGFPPPAEVLDATLVYFDPDGRDAQMGEPPPGPIDDAAGLAAFVERYVDGDPALPAAAARAIEAGSVLIAGVASSGCFTAAGAQLAVVDGDVRLLPVGLPSPEPEIACARAITSVAVMAIAPADLPAGVTVQGT